jgi:hypothetical protein
MQTSLKLLRIIQLAMLVSIGLYAFMAARYGPAPKAVSPVFTYSIVAVAIAMIAAILLARRVIVKPAETTLTADSENAAALNRWRVGYIAVLGLSEVVALYAVVLRFVGLEFQQVVPFFLAGFILMLYFGPRAPANAIG